LARALLGRPEKAIAYHLSPFVVIELKVYHAYDPVIWQLLRYMAWIKKHHAESDQGVRGIIAAREISKDLKLACSYLPNVSLYEYALSVALRKVVVDAIVKD
jgi:endonuclease